MIDRADVPMLEIYKGFTITILADNGFYRGFVRWEDGRRFSALAITGRSFAAFDLERLMRAIHSAKQAIDTGEFA